MTAINMTAADLTAAISAVRALRREVGNRRCFLPRSVAAEKLRRIEEMLTPRETETLTSPVPEFDTVLGWLAKNDPFTLDMMMDPVRETIRDGFWLTNQARKRGLPVIKVDAPASVTTRYPEVTKLNAYPVELLRERFA